MLKMFKNKDAEPKELTYDYWKKIHSPEYIRTTQSYWEKIQNSRGKEWTEKEILDMADHDMLNVLVIEHLMGWKWSEQAKFFVSDIDDAYLSMGTKCITTMTHWVDKNGEAWMPPMYVDPLYVPYFINELKNQENNYHIKMNNVGSTIRKEGASDFFVFETVEEGLAKMVILNKVIH